MRITLLAIVCIAFTGCAAQHVMTPVPAKKLTPYQRGVQDGIARAERSYPAELVHALEAKGFTDTNDAYKSCIETIVRVGKMNTEYRTKLEAISK